MSQCATYQTFYFVQPAPVTLREPQVKLVTKMENAPANLMLWVTNATSVLMATKRFPTATLVQLNITDIQIVNLVNVTLKDPKATLVMLMVNVLANAILLGSSVTGPSLDFMTFRSLWIAVVMNKDQETTLAMKTLENVLANQTSLETSVRNALQKTTDFRIVKLVCAIQKVPMTTCVTEKAVNVFAKITSPGSIVTSVPVDFSDFPIVANVLAILKDLQA